MRGILYDYDFDLISNAECPKLSLTSGDLYLRLKVIDEMTSVNIRLRNTRMETGNAEDGRLSRSVKNTSEIGDMVSSQLSENDDLYQDIRSLLLKLDVFAKVAGDFAAVRFCSPTQFFLLKLFIS